MEFDFLGNMFGGLLYLFSSRYRAKKRKEWVKHSATKIYDIGMWVTIPLILSIVFVIIFSKRNM